MSIFIHPVERNATQKNNIPMDLLDLCRNDGNSAANDYDGKTILVELL